MTIEHEKHVFSSFISRDTTFKLMTRLWKRAMRDLGPQEERIVSNVVVIGMIIISSQLIYIYLMYAHLSYTTHT